ncbi:MAG TPA: MBL fold metallo-hydrolase [Fluviicoccus sp.]|nr:MBL fold metallo-hydrolase [Fluviicoccus sp.]
MPFEPTLDLGHGITRIESGMVRDELVACYLVHGGEEYALIETGTNNSVPRIMDLLAQRQIRPEQVTYVVPTHVHLDHAGGVGGLMQCLPEATLLVHPKGARHLIEPGKLKAGAIAVYGEAEFAKVYGDIMPVEASRVRSMEDGSEALLGSRKLVFLDTPGHARHHFCVFDPESRGIFTGDTFGLAYPALTTAKGPFIIPTTTPVQFEPEALKASIKRLLALQPERMYLTHYGVVENPQGLGERLLGQVDDYVARALAARDAGGAGDLEARLVAGMRAYLFARAREHGCGQGDEELEGLLGMDLRLNAQGLGVWLAGLTSTA